MAATNPPREYPVTAAEAGTELLVISFVAGASGAVGAFSPTTRRKGFRATTPVVRNSAGNYTVFTATQYLDLMYYIANCNGPISSVDGKYADVVSDSLTSSTPSVTLQFKREDTGAVADPASGDQVYITLFLKRKDPR